MKKNQEGNLSPTYSSRRMRYFLAAAVLSFLSLFLFPTGSYAQTQIITGTVTNDHKTPIEGASVKQKGTSNGTLTDEHLEGSRPCWSSSHCRHLSLRRLLFRQLPCQSRSG